MEGVFLQVIISTERSLEIPGRDFDFWTLLRAQADGDAGVLAATGQPVLSLTGPEAEVGRLMAALSA
jgi:glucose-6-phosphate isomerase